MRIIASLFAVNVYPRFRVFPAVQFLLTGALLLASASALHGHGEVDDELVEHFGEYLDDFAAEVEKLADMADGIVETHDKGESTEASIKAWIEVWEEVGIHGVIEAKAVHLYPPIWQGVYAMVQVGDEGGSTGEMRAAAEKTKSALWQSLGGLRALAALPGKGEQSEHDGPEDHHDHADHGEDDDHKVKTPTAHDEDGAVVTGNRIELTGDDQMLFNKTRFMVKAGEPVTLHFENIGELPVEVMGHNVVVLERGTPIKPFGLAAAEAQESDYIPTEPELANAIVAHTAMLGPGQEETITFTLDEPGEYPFICSFTAHWRLMKGVIEAVADPGTQPVEAILTQLEASAEAYAEGDAKKAESLVHSAYMEIFEGLEGDLIEKDPDLVHQLELAFNAGLPLLYQGGAAQSEVRAQIDKMRARLKQCKAYLEEAEAERGSVF